MINYRFKKNVLLILPSPESRSIVDITKIIDQIKPSDHVIVWQPWEETDHRFSEYLEHDYDIDNNHPQNITEFENVLLKNNIRCYLLVGSDYSDAYLNIRKSPIKNFRVLFWPTALLHYTYYGFIGRYNKTPKDLYNPNREVNKLYLNLNNKDRNHRCLFIDYLCKFNLFNEGINTWKNEKTQYDFKYFRPQRLTIDEYHNKKYVHEVYSDELINTSNLIDVVTETYPYNKKGKEYIFHTEKTFRSIIMGRPFIVLGAKNQNVNLKKYGFTLFESLFDYDFDNFDTIKSRCLGVIDNLYSVKNKNFKDIHIDINNIIERNIDISTNIVYNDENIPDVLISLIRDNMLEYRLLFRDFNSSFSGSFDFNQKWYITDKIFKQIYQ